LLAALCLTLSSAAVTAEEQKQEKVSLEFLEYLGTWEEKDGEWMDPVQLEEIEEPRKDRRNPRPVDLNRRTDR
jgi:hypothetical protein